MRTPRFLLLGPHRHACLSYSSYTGRLQLQTAPSMRSLVASSIVYHAITTMAFVFCREHRHDAHSQSRSSLSSATCFMLFEADARNRAHLRSAQRKRDQGLSSASGKHRLWHLCQAGYEAGAWYWHRTPSLRRLRRRGFYRRKRLCCIPSRSNRDSARTGTQLSPCSSWIATLTTVLSIATAANLKQ